MHFRFYGWRHICSQAKVARRSRPAEAQCRLYAALGLAVNCAVIPVAGQRTHGTTVRALKVTSQDCLVLELNTAMQEWTYSHFHGFIARQYRRDTHCIGLKLILLIKIEIAVTATLNFTWICYLLRSLNVICCHERPHIGENGVSWPLWKNEWKIIKRKHADKSSFLNGGV